MAIEVSANNFDEEVLQSDIPVVVDFWASWCGPCRTLAPVLEELFEEYKGKVKVCKINVDLNQEIARQFQVMSIPNLVYFKSGKKVDQTVGFMPKLDLAKKLDSLL